QRRTKGKRRRHNSPGGRGVRTATITGSVAATAAIGLAAGAGPADAVSVDAALVKDINPSGAALPYNDHVKNAMAEVNGTLFFVADDGTSGRELWKSDGT